MKTIAIANQKGGTGKTTTAYNLGIALTQQGYRVLMVDFDPQGNLSCYCGIPPEQDLEQTITELLMKVAYEKPLSHRECVYQSKRTDDSAPQVDFIPSNLRLASFELAMGTMMCREVLLKTCLEQYSSQYDYCIIDCSPSVGLLLTNALSAANEVIIPMQAQPFSVVGMSQLTNSISSVQRKINPGLHIRGVLLTMTQHTKVSEHYAHDVRAKYGRTLRVFTTEIPYNVKVQESQAFAAPTILYEPKSSSARAYVDFTQEVLGHGREEQVYERDVYNAMASLSIATLCYQELHGIAVNFLKSYLAVALQGAVLYLVIGFYPALAGSLGTGGSITEQAWAMLGQSVILLVAVFMSGKFTKAITNAMT